MRFLVLLLCFWPTFTWGQKLNHKLPISAESCIDSLKNGFQYILHPSNDAGIEVRLVIHVGSLQENSKQLGFAHYLEHMLFNSNQEFPNNTLRDRLEMLGYRFGRDFNAYTNYDRTVLSFKLIDKAHLPLLLAIIQQMLHTAEINEQEFEKERKIIIQEIHDNSEETIFVDAKIAGTRYADRLPIGNPEAIYNAKAPALKEFYKKWYRPELFTLIICGDIALTTTEEAIKQKFSDLQPSLIRKSRLQNLYSFQPSYTRQFDQRIDKTLKSNKLEITSFSVAPPVRRVPDFQRQVLEELYKKFIAKKLNQFPDLAKYFINWFLPNMNEVTLVLSSDSRKDLLKKIEQTAQLMTTISNEGITNEEFETLKVDYLAHAGSSKQIYPTAAVADYYVDQAAIQEYFLTNKQRLLLITQILPEIQAADLCEIHQKRWFPKENKRFYLMDINPSLFEIEGFENLEEAWQKGINRKQTLRPPVGVGKPFSKKKASTDSLSFKNFSWQQLPAVRTTHAKTGIAKEQYFRELNCTEITLDNGLRIALKPNKNTNKEIVLAFNTSKGLQQLSAKAYPYYQEINYFLSNSWLKGLHQEASQELAMQKNITSYLYIDDFETVLQASVRHTEGALTDLIEMCYRRLYLYEQPKAEFKEFKQAEIAKLTKPAHVEDTVNSPFFKYPNLDKKRRIQAYKSAYRESVDSLWIAEEHELENVDWRKVKLSKMFLFFDALISQPTENYIVLSGNFDLAEAKSLLSSYFGAIPTVKKNKKPHYKNNKTYQKNRSTVQQPENTAERQDFTILYPGVFQRTLKARIITQMITEQLTMDLINTTREQLGLVYTPSVDIELLMNPQPRSFLSINFSAQSSDIAQLQEATKRLLSKLQQEELSSTQLVKLKRKIAINKQIHLDDSSAQKWAETLQSQYLMFDSLTDFNDYERLLKEITTADIRACAQQLYATTAFQLFY